MYSGDMMLEDNVLRLEQQLMSDITDVSSGIVYVCYTYIVYCILFLFILYTECIVQYKVFIKPLLCMYSICIYCCAFTFITTPYLHPYYYHHSY